MSKRTSPESRPMS
uniref:Uncharacterized protein n=1 Tax=Arundo donax TaxID=35708 RepID=A0A0A9AZI5_ARUDO